MSGQRTLCSNIDNAIIDNIVLGELNKSVNDVDIAVAALADPTRRQVIELLIEAPLRTNELADAIGVSVPAVSRHLRVLREKNLVERIDVEGDGRGRQYQLNPDRLTALADWLNPSRWTDRLPNVTNDPDLGEFLSRVGHFLDAFANSDVDFFKRHLSPDVELIFPGSSRRWDKTSTIASVAGHAPYVEWSISDSTIRPLSPNLTLVTICAAVRTAEAADPTLVVQSMVFDDSNQPWSLRLLHQSPAGAT